MDGVMEWIDTDFNRTESLDNNKLPRFTGLKILKNDIKSSANQ